MVGSSKLFTADKTPTARRELIPATHPVALRTMNDSIPCRVTFPAHVRIGGGDPRPIEETSFEGRYRSGVVFAPRLLEDGSQVWDAGFTVEGRPVLGDRPIKRAMTNHGTYAAHFGGSPVVIERL